MTNPKDVYEFADLARRVAACLSRLSEHIDAIRADVVAMAALAVNMMAEFEDDMNADLDH